MFVKSQPILQLAMVNVIVCKVYLNKTGLKGSVENSVVSGEKILELVNTWKWSENSWIAEFHPESGPGLKSGKKN